MYTEKSPRWLLITPSGSALSATIYSQYTLATQGITYTYTCRLFAYSHDLWDIGFSPTCTCILPAFSLLHFMYTLVYDSQSASSAVWQVCVPAFQGRACAPECSYSRPSAMLMTIKDVFLMVRTGFGKLIEYAVFAVTK